MNADAPAMDTAFRRRGRWRRSHVFARDETGAPLPWIVAVMVLLAAIAASAAFAVAGIASRWQSALSGTITVEIAPLEAAGTTATGTRSESDRLTAAIDLLRATSGIADARPIDRRRLVELLAPWLGRQGDAADLPLPQLIDVTLISGASLDARQLESRLAASVPGTRVDDHGQWTSGLVRLARLAVGGALALVVAVGFVASLAVVLVTRARLAAQRDAVALLHLMGASDAYIAGALAHDAARLAFAGAACGMIGAALAAAALLWAAPTQDPGIVARVIDDPAAWATLIALPLAAAALAAATAWATARRALRRMV